MKINIELSLETYDELVVFATRNNCSKTEAIKRLLSLVKVSNSLHQQNRSIGIVSEQSGELVAIGRVLGF